MHSHVNDWTEWGLVIAAVLLLGLLHRAELIPVVAPVALLFAYVVSALAPAERPSQRKMLERK